MLGDIMLIAIIGENCVGKSTLANKINEKINGKIYSGKDYLRLEKNSSVALDKFKKILNDTVNGENLIYIITEKEHLNLLPSHAFKIVLTAKLEIIKERFKKRMNGNLPLSLEKMLESKHGIYDELKCNIKLDENYNVDEVCHLIENIINKTNIKVEFSAMAVVFSENKILSTLELIYGKETLSLPKGHVEENESSLNAAIRECYEETNIKISEKDLIKEICPYTYEFLTPSNTWIRKTLIPYLFVINDFGNPIPKEERMVSVQWMDIDEFLLNCRYENVKSIVKESMKYYIN